MKSKLRLDCKCKINIFKLKECGLKKELILFLLYCITVCVCVCACAQCHFFSWLLNLKDTWDHRHTAWHLASDQSQRLQQDMLPSDCVYTSPQGLGITSQHTIYKISSCLATKATVKQKKRDLVYDCQSHQREIFGLTFQMTVTLTF